MAVFNCMYCFQLLHSLFITISYMLEWDFVVKYMLLLPDWLTDWLAHWRMDWLAGWLAWSIKQSKRSQVVYSALWGAWRKDEIVSLTWSTRLLTLPSFIPAFLEMTGDRPQTCCTISALGKCPLKWCWWRGMFGQPLCCDWLFVWE